jgi:hypothetical protein
MEENNYYIPENLIENSKEEHLSLSGKYKLIIEEYTTENGFGNVSLGKVFLTSSNECLFEVKRNYNIFPFLFTEEHPNGNDYLICGEDYQGQTILELNTGKRLDYLPEGTKNGVGFCWRIISCSQEKDVLGVQGCFWACPEEQIFVDFSEPMKLPYLIFSVFPSIDDNSAVKNSWSSAEGVEITYSGYDEIEKKTVLWKKPKLIDVARYWLKEKNETKSDSYFYPDIKKQTELSIEKLNRSEIEELKAENLILV